MPRQSDINIVRGYLKPNAWCQGAPTRKCTWALQRHAPDYTIRELQTFAKQHVIEYPGHECVIEQTIRTSYKLRPLTGR